MAKQAFKAKLESVGPNRSWTYLRLPFSVEKEFSSRARVAVCGTLNGFAFRTSVFPEGNGVHTMMVNKSMMAGARARPGDTVAVLMEPDTQPRIVEVPEALKKGLARNRKARLFFEKLSYSHRKKYADWIAEAKQEETRKRRVAQAVWMLAAGAKRD